MHKIHFETATLTDKDIIFGWLDEPHMQEFWDNSDAHREDILNFMQGKKQTYICGTAKYWIGYYDDQPYSFLLSDQLLPEQEDLDDLHRKWLSREGHTIALDFGIGNKSFLGKGLAAPTLEAFVAFYQASVDPKADTFFIDPDKNNPRARHVYEKAGFQDVGQFTPEKGYFLKTRVELMVKSLK